MPSQHLQRVIREHVTMRMPFNMFQKLFRTVRPGLTLARAGVAVQCHRVWECIRRSSLVSQGARRFKRFYFHNCLETFVTRLHKLKAIRTLCLANRTGNKCWTNPWYCVIAASLTSVSPRSPSRYLVLYRTLNPQQYRKYLPNLHDAQNPEDSVCCGKGKIRMWIPFRSEVHYHRRIGPLRQCL